MKAKAARVDPRVPASAVPSITAVRLSAGEAARSVITSGTLVALINISRSGMLVEGRTRLVPGSRVTVIIEGTFQPSHVRANVVRCHVTSISNGALRYQCGLQFDQPLDRIPTDSQAAAAAPGAPGKGQLEFPMAEGVLMNRW